MKKIFIFFDNLIFFIKIFFSLSNYKETNFKLEKNKIELNGYPNHNYHQIFPWGEVLRCFSKQLQNTQFKNRNQCPKCGCDAEKLIWVLYKSDEDSWGLLAGIGGPLSICPNCKIQVEFILESMS